MSQSDGFKKVFLDGNFFSAEWNMKMTFFLHRAKNVVYLYPSVCCRSRI